MKTCFTEQTFNDCVITVDDKLFDNCRFERCRLIANEPYDMNSCLLLYCELVGEGWPLSSITMNIDNNGMLLV